MKAQSGVFWMTVHLFVWKGDERKDKGCYRGILLYDEWRVWGDEFLLFLVRGSHSHL